MYKSPKIEIDLDRLQDALDYRYLVNSADLSAIIWVRDGLAIEVSEEDIKEWKFNGLSNACFAASHGLVNES
jgi:hypothetical protein